MAPPKVAFAEPVHVGFLPKEQLRGVPRAVLADYASRGWRFAAITLPEAKGRVRVGAVAFAFPAKRPLLPLRLAEALPAHTLDLTVLAAGRLPDLGGMDFALGLARAPGGPVPPALARWARKQVGLAVPVRSDFAAAAVNGPLRPLMRFDGDLTLPPPKVPSAGSIPFRDGGAHALDVPPGWGGAGADGGSARAADRAVTAAPRRSGSGCGACAAAGGGAGDLAWLVLGAVALAGLRRRRRT